ncbi:uncharacterized protein EI90DRAFT_3016270 [Cantharellus anzutake]|uniref:uncharacterized protein n=1 Tax=Cantharellus anzutake TaxID=1750568 RepID=UPI0019078C94|nr:uncharacterized protein EI90DRAFT_3016270 [Cantharellus anzutake]KAF8331715.1 hypothetical protein EI90DRAFT_3016270 [Cantharellus anzutake]
MKELLEPFALLHGRFFANSGFRGHLGQMYWSLCMIRTVSSSPKKLPNRMTDHISITGPAWGKRAACGRKRKAKDESALLAALDRFKARLKDARVEGPSSNRMSEDDTKPEETGEDGEEAALEVDNDTGWMSHRLPRNDEMHRAEHDYEVLDPRAKARGIREGGTGTKEVTTQAAPKYSPNTGKLAFGPLEWMVVRLIVAAGEVGAVAMVGLVGLGRDFVWAMRWRSLLESEQMRFVLQDSSGEGRIGPDPIFPYSSTCWVDAESSSIPRVVVQCLHPFVVNRKETIAFLMSRNWYGHGNVLSVTLSVTALVEMSGTELW